MMLLFQPSYPPITLAPYANLPVLRACPTALASYLALQFSAVGLLQVESAYKNKMLCKEMSNMMGPAHLELGCIDLGPFNPRATQVVLGSPLTSPPPFNTQQ